MKYQIGDIVKIRKLRQTEYLIFQNRIGIILEVLESPVGDEEYNMFQAVIAYRILVAGIEGKKHFVYEEEIEGKIE